MSAIKEREAQRTRVRQDLAALEELDLVRGLDLHRVEKNLRAKLAEWRVLLTRNVQAARQVLRGLVPERLTFTPMS